ncbi:hypothetical protein CPB83DRAFT_855394 [Crepidotus variabilis]|uniref:Uncharacterized protein n=1 Tax=Crepidotus variabilis TaxID=179855 RepID=A0A9P6EFB0_9AGAR|nr:hypothetical protein CPB83DRAFT_855394 [Crepidotus variabilis]
MSNPSEPLVLTWQPEPPPILPDEHPPDYSSASRPTINVRYIFSPIAGQNAMLVVPPAESPDTRPKFYIALSTNIFMPFSYITTIY